MENETEKTPKQYLPGHYVSLGVALGLPLGVAVGVAIGNIGIGPAIGVALGAGIGAGLEAKAKAEGKVRALTPEEQRKVHKKLWIVLAIGTLVATSAILLYVI